MIAGLGLQAAGQADCFSAAVFNGDPGPDIDITRLDNHPADLHALPQSFDVELSHVSRKAQLCPVLPPRDKKRPLRVQETEKDPAMLNPASILTDCSVRVNTVSAYIFYIYTYNLGFIILMPQPWRRTRSHELSVKIVLTPPIRMIPGTRGK